MYYIGISFFGGSGHGSNKKVESPGFTNYSRAEIIGSAGG
jgi:hypothetical protein